jgi:hypothetical protein
MDLEKGLPKYVLLAFENYKYLQLVDYEQLPFKCCDCQEYGHSRSYTKKESTEKEIKNVDEQWKIARRRKNDNSKSSGPTPPKSLRPTQSSKPPNGLNSDHINSNPSRNG